MLLPVVHDALHRDFFKLSGNAQFRCRAVLRFQRMSDSFPIVFIQCPCFNLPRAFACARICYIEYIAHCPRPVRQRDTPCAAPNIPPHRLIPDFIAGAGGCVRTLCINHQLVVKAIFIYVGSRRQKRAPIFPIGGDLPHGLLGKLHIIFHFCHLIAPAFLSISVSFFFLGTPLFASYPQFINRFRRVFNMDVHNLST